MTEQQETWTAPEDCAECGFVATVVSPSSAEAAVHALGGRYQAVLAGAGREEITDAVLRRRRDADTWSALEYAAHMRDVIALWGWALHRTLTEDRPQLPPADPDLPDRAAAAAAYNDQDPLLVSQELSENAERMAKKVATIKPDQWHRVALFGDAEVTPLWIVRKVAHEGHHHLQDIDRSLRVVRRN